MIEKRDRNRTRAVGRAESKIAFAPAVCPVLLGHGYHLKHKRYGALDAPRLGDASHMPSVLIRTRVMAEQSADILDAELFEGFCPRFSYAGECGYR